MIAASARGESLLHKDVSRLGQSSLRMMTIPVRARGSEWLIATGVAAGITASSALDRAVRNDARSWNEAWHDDVSRIGHGYADDLVIWGAGPALYVAGAVMRKPGLRRVGIEAAQAVGFTGAMGAALKCALGRDRPFHERGPFHFIGPNLRDGYMSFPSGDTSTAFALSSVLAAETKSWPLRIGLYALATCTAFQRIDADRHWFSDVVGGAVLGTAVGWGIVKIHRILESEEIQK